MFIFQLDTGHSGLRYTVLSSLCLKFFKMKGWGTAVCSSSGEDRFTGLGGGAGEGRPMAPALRQDSSSGRAFRPLPLPLRSAVFTFPWLWQLEFCFQESPSSRGQQPDKLLLIFRVLSSTGASSEGWSSSPSG